MVVGIDPETGVLGPASPEQMHALGAREPDAVSRSAEGLVEIHRPDGAVGVNLQGRFQDYTVVQVTPGGKRVFRCLNAGDKPIPPADSVLVPQRSEEQ